MTPLNPKAALAEFSRLRAKLENTCRNEVAEGFIRNRFGTFDRQDITDQILALFSQLVSQHPDEDYYRFLLAAALGRANELHAAETIYADLAKRSEQYSEASYSLLSSILRLQDRTEEAQIALDAYNKSVTSRGFPQLRKTLDKM